MNNTSFSVPSSSRNGGDWEGGGVGGGGSLSYSATSFTMLEYIIWGKAK